MTTDVHPSDVLVPKCLWAQRHDRIYLTIDVFDPKDVDIKLDAGSLNVRCTRSEDNAKFAVDLEFFDTVVPAESQKSTTGRNISFILLKEKDDQPYWPRLVKDTKKLHYIAVDFTKWVDEDEEDSKGGNDFMGNGMGDFSSFDPSQFANMQDYDEDEIAEEEEEDDAEENFDQELIKEAALAQDNGEDDEEEKGEKKEQENN